ncbi:MAG: hypothetical protein ACO1QR_07950 [Chthoniobacteraceae bacterium]
MSAPPIMKLLVFLPTLAVLTLNAAAQNDELARADAEFLAQFESSFELGGATEAKQFLSEDLMSGPLHTVAPLTYNDGLNNTYLLTAEGVDEEITGTLALRARIREVYAIDALRRTNKTEEFRKALTESGRQKVDGVVKLVKDPAHTLAAIPKGASRFFGRIGEGLKGGQTEGEDPAIQSLTGVSKAKAKLAVELGVSPYSLNPDLQHELTETARAMAGGGLVLTAATAAVGGAASSVVSALGVNETLQQTLINNTPSDLRIINRKKLFTMGVDRATADEFLMHPWYSPLHATITTDALANIGINPSAFLQQASRALTPEDALFFQRIAQVLARYHRTKAPLRAIDIKGNVVCATDRDGLLLVPLSCDYAIWAERAARRVDQFAALAIENSKIKGLALWVDGKVSNRLRQELAARKIEVVESVLNQEQ